MKHIHFIINPIAGPGKHRLTYESLQSYFEKEKYALNIKYTSYKRHARLLAKESVEQLADIIVACGGDGTINEVASCLVGSTISLGIIPLGSGNGLASHLRIPSKIQRAISIIKTGNSTRIDVGNINEHHFFSNMGIGFDASVIRNYEASKKRMLRGYALAFFDSLKEYRSSKDLEIVINDVHSIEDPFMIFISNSNEMGYNMTLTPKASLQDGMLDVLIISKMSRLKMLFLGVLILLKKPHLLKQVKSFQTKEIKFRRPKRDELELQIDGDLYKFEDENLSVSIKEKSLKVLVLE